MIKIEYTYSVHATVLFYGEDGITFRYNDTGFLGDVVERVTEDIVKHNFVNADITDANTGEVLATVTRE